MSNRTDVSQMTKWDAARTMLTETGEISPDTLTQFSEPERESIRMALDELAALGVVSAEDEETWTLVHVA